MTAKYFDLAERLDANPVHGVDGTGLRGMTFALLYGDANMPSLAENWQALDKGRPLPSSPPEVTENLLAARLYVIYGDSRWPETVRVAVAR